MNNSANREHHKGDEYIIDEINPVPRRKKLRFIRFAGIKYYRTPYKGYYISKKGILLSRKQNKCYFPQNYLRGNYYRVALYINKRKRYISVHKLVMETFYGECPKGYSVDHIDCDTTNNSLSNLRYLTYRDNARREHCGKPSGTSLKVVGIIDGVKKTYDSVKAFWHTVHFSSATWKKLKNGIYPKGIKSRFIVHKFVKKKKHYLIIADLNPNRQRKFLGRIFT